MPELQCMMMGEREGQAEQEGQRKHTEYNSEREGGIKGAWGGCCKSINSINVQSNGLAY